MNYHKSTLFECPCRISERKSGWKTFYFLALGMVVYCAQGRNVPRQMMRNPEETIGKMIDKAKTSFISYVDDSGYPVTKAMLNPRERKGIKVIWCFKNNSKASLYFVDKRFFRGVSLIGNIEVLETPEAKEKIWREGDEMYYKEGVTDPDYCVLKFTAVKGRYYSNFKSEDFEI